MTSLLLPGVELGAKPKPSCPRCGGKLVMRRCRPCQKDTPRIGGAAWKRWTNGLQRIVVARCEAAGLGRLDLATWEALLLDTSMPPETAALVADIATLPFSAKRYRAVLDRAVTRSMIFYGLAKLPEMKPSLFPHKADNIAGVASKKIWAQRDRVAAGEVFERRHDAELVHEAIVEYETREALQGRLRGAVLETAVQEAVAREAERVRGFWGRPSDEYRKAARVELRGLRVEALPVRLADGIAEEEAAEVEATVSRMERAA